MSKLSVRTQRLRYLAARPFSSRTPCTMPSPVNQCALSWRGFGPLRGEGPPGGQRQPETGERPGVVAKRRSRMGEGPRGQRCEEDDRGALDEQRFPALAAPAFGEEQPPREHEADQPGPPPVGLRGH